MEMSIKGKLAANFFRNFFCREGVLDPGGDFLIHGRVEDYDLDEVRKEVKEFCLITNEGVSDDGQAWAMSVYALDMGDFRGDEYEEWVKAAEENEERLRDVLKRCHRRVKVKAKELTDEEFNAVMKEIDEMVAAAP